MILGKAAWRTLASAEAANRHQSLVPPVGLGALVEIEEGRI